MEEDPYHFETKLSDIDKRKVQNQEDIEKNLNTFLKEMGEDSYHFN